jgi:heptosyltransferase-1
MVCPGSNWPNKQLAPETLQGFLDRISRHIAGARFHLVWGTPEEKQLADSLCARYPGSIIVDKLPLPSLQALMAKMKLVIAMDSLPLHLAGTTSALTYSVFGASSAAKYNPLGAEHRALQGTCPYGRTFAKRCPILRTCPTGACIKGLTSEQIWNDFWPWYKGHGA